MEKVNYPKNSLFCINQAYSTTQKGENILYGDHFILGQIIPVVKVPTYIGNCKCLSDEVKLWCYDVKELNETMGLLSMRVDFDITFF